MHNLSITNGKNQEYTMEPRLGPDKCLKRWCRICGKEMELEYDFNPDNRVYDFSCTRCGTTVRIFEDTFKEMRDAFRSDGRLLEPLTEEEEAKQVSDMEASKIFFKEYLGNTRKSWKEKEGIANRKRYKLDDNEAEKLR
ncbi:MAG TPA: hypothetical protein VFX64_01995 [Candidatus Nitrosotalea sp.]|nr:hypothetical protein [Candidatus Nitrosotalea sp.]